MTDASGQVTLTQSYDPFGNVNYHTGSGQSVYGYTSEQTDANGLVFLRARYYDPYLNQFIQPDTIVPDPRIPADLAMNCANEREFFNQFAKIRAIRG